MITLQENSTLYTTVEFLKKGLVPFRNVIHTMQQYNQSPINLFRESMLSKTINANLELVERITRDYKKPEWNIKKVTYGKVEADVQIEKLMDLPFGNLIRFKKMVDGKVIKNQKKLLIVAPMSGHYPTLLRGTVKDCLNHFDVYITEWKNANNISIDHGKFDLDDYIYYVMDFVKKLGKGISIMAVCQPVVPVAAAVSLLEEDGDNLVDNMILMGGPIDPRKANTKVTDFADKRHMTWFEAQMVTRVPPNYPGFMRQVYPGFIQLMGFMSMNMQRHIGKHVELYQHLVAGDGDGAKEHKAFYDEYLAVMDIPAEFYIETIKTVYKDFALPNGTMMVGNRRVNTSAVKHSKLIVVEGGLDDIAGVGQTKAAIDMFKNIPKDNKHYHLQADVGHYGVFNGKKFREFILKAIKDFCYA